MRQEGKRSVSTGSPKDLRFDLVLNHSRIYLRRNQDSGLHVRCMLWWHVENSECVSDNAYVERTLHRCMDALVRSTVAGEHNMEVAVHNRRVPVDMYTVEAVRSKDIRLYWDAVLGIVHRVRSECACRGCVETGFLGQFAVVLGHD